MPELTCLENTALPLRLGGVRRREAERRAGEWLERLEVTDVAGKRPGEISGGRGQRVAFGTRRGTMTWSALFQTAVPVLLGLTLATVLGTGLGTVMRRMVREPVRVNWTSLLQLSGVAAGMVLLVTLLNLPALWRLMRPDGLRAE